MIIHRWYKHDRSDSSAKFESPSSSALDNGIYYEKNWDLIFILLDKSINIRVKENIEMYPKKNGVENASYFKKRQNKERRHSWDNVNEGRSEYINEFKVELHRI
jgi:hypothetical protein